MKKGFHCQLISITVIFVTVLSVFSQTPPPDDDAVFSAVVKSKGGILYMPLNRWGRFSLRTIGEEPAALSVADKRNGIFARDGEVGQRNARLDMFLDIGEYKLQVQGAQNGTGNTTVKAFPFSYPDGYKPSYLIPLRENSLTLKDMQQVSFWFEVDCDTSVYIEAVGRYLADMRLWRDGDWMVTTEKHGFTFRPKPETPLKGIAMYARIPKGTYMVAVYGGPGLDWAIESSSGPLYLQWGMEKLHTNCLSVVTIPPKGYVHLSVEPDVSDIILEGTESQHLVAEVFTTGASLVAGSRIARDSVHAKSSSPRARLSINTSSSNRIVRIAGKPGQVFTLQTMGRLISQLKNNNKSDYWISSFHTGDCNDQFGASAVIVDQSAGNSIAALQADTITLEKGLARKFNLLQPINAYVWVDNDGKYTFAPGGTGYSWRFYRFFTTPPANFVIPDFQEKPSDLDLSRGLYLLELRPREKGIATLKIGKASLIGNIISLGKNVLGATDENQQWDRPRPAVQFERMHVDSGHSYGLLINNQSPEMATFSTRMLPVDPDTPLAVWCTPSVPVRIPVNLKAKRMVSVTDMWNKPVPFSIDGTTYNGSATIGSGEYTLTIIARGQAVSYASVKAVPPERVISSPAPVFPDEKREALRRFPSLSPGKARFLDLDRNSGSIYNIETDQPSFYRIETTGRLATQILLRDRFNVFSLSAQKNGVGRNAMLIAYLLPGRYQVTVATLDRSTGHLGVTVYRNPAVEGGIIEPDIDNKAMVPAFSGLQYDLRIPSDGTYKIESFGQKGNFSIRLEDSLGWPFEPAVSSGPFQLSLEKGSCKLISLPTAQESRRIGRLSSVDEQRKITGKGPHTLELNSPLSSIWVEDTTTDTDGKPVVFTLDIPAPISANLSITDGHTASLFIESKNDPIHSWSGKHSRALDAGRYRLEVKPVKKSNYAPYQVSVSTIDLIAGLSYQVTKPKTLRVSVGTAGVVQFVSQGTLDVSAQLFDESAKTVIASNDDGYLDWNFAISRVLKPGRYFLKIESPEGRFSSTRVFMTSMTDTLLDTLSALDADKPVVLQRNLNRHIGIFPISSLDKGDIITCAVQGKARTGCSIERHNGTEWLPVAQNQGDHPTLTIPRESSANYRIRVWSDYNSNEDITLTYANIDAKFLSWKDLSGGVSLKTKKIGENNLVWFKVDLQDKAPGHFSATGSDRARISTIAVSLAADSQFEIESSSWFSSTQRYAWVETDFENDGKYRLKFEPMILDDKMPLSIILPGSRPQVFETKQDKKSVALLSVYSDRSYPLAGVLKETNGAPSLDIRGVAVEMGMWSDGSRCAAVSFPDDKQKVAIWNSFPVSEGILPTAELTWTELPLVDAGVQTYGVSSWIPEKHSARVSRFPKGTGYRVRVTIPDGCAAVFTRSDGSRVLERAGDGEAKVVEYFADGEKLYLLGLQKGKRFDIAAFALKADALNAPDRVFLTGDRLKTRMSTDGSITLPLAETGSVKSCYYSGDVNALHYVSRKGILKNGIGEGSPVGPGGFLIVDHTSGWITVNLCSDASPEAVMTCKWGASLESPKQRGISESSQYLLSNGVNWFSFTINDTQHVNCSAPLPLSAILLKDDKPVQYLEASEEFNWDLPLVKGHYRLGIQANNGSSLDRAELAILFRPVHPITENNPFRGYIASGESRILSFIVGEKSAFGIGLRLAKEVVNAVLFDADGRQIASGKQQFLTLDKGIYYLHLRVPALREGTECTAYLFGQEVPPNEPPQKLVQWIISGAQGPRPSTDSSDDDELKNENAQPAWMNLIRDETINRSPNEEASEDGEYYEGEEEYYEESEEESEYSEEQEY